MSWDNKHMADMRAPEIVEVLIDKTNMKWKLWVNVDGACRLRIYDIDPETFTLDTRTIDK